MANFFSLPFPVRISNDSPTDERFPVADDAARDQMITDLRAYVGMIVYNEASSQHQFLSVLDPGLPGTSVWVAFGGGGAVPGGAEDEIQFNVGGVFTGDAGFYYDAAKDMLVLGTGGANPNFVGAHAQAGSWSIISGEEHDFSGGGRSVNLIVSGWNNKIGDIAIAGTHSGAASSTLGNFNINNAVYGVTIGYGLQTGAGESAFVAGRGWDNGSTGVINERLQALGFCSINISNINADHIVGEGALGANGGIIGGINHNVPADSPRVMIIGGNRILASAVTPDTVYVPHLRVGQGTGATIVEDATATMIAVIDATTGQIKWRDVTSIGSGGSFVSPLTTKGDLLAFTTADVRLGVGANGQVLVSDSVSPEGIKWANNIAPAGSVEGAVQLRNSDGTLFSASDSLKFSTTIGLEYTTAVDTASAFVLKRGVDLRVWIGNLGNDGYVALYDNTNTETIRFSALDTGGSFMSNPMMFGTNASPLAGVQMQIDTTTKGFLIPRHTTIQRNALGALLGATQKGLKVYDTDLSSEYSWDGTAWVSLLPSKAVGLVNHIQVTDGSGAFVDGRSSIDPVTGNLVLGDITLTGSERIISSTGSSANINLTHLTKGTGTHWIKRETAGTTVLNISDSLPGNSAQVNLLADSDTLVPNILITNSGLSGSLLSLRASGGDSYIRLGILSGQHYAFGLDDSDVNKAFKFTQALSHTVDLDDALIFKIDPDGLITMNSNVGGGGTVNFLRADGQWAPAAVSPAGTTEGAIQLRDSTGLLFDADNNFIYLKSTGYFRVGATNTDNMQWNFGTLSVNNATNDASVQLLNSGAILVSDSAGSSSVRLNSISGTNGSYIRETIAFGDIVNANDKSQVDISSTTKGLLIPRHTTAQRTAMTLIAGDIGMKVYDTDLLAEYIWNGTTWGELASTTPAKTTYQDVTGVEPSYVEGQTFYANGGLNFHGEFPEVTLQIGQEQFIKVHNNTGVTLLNGSAVYFTGVVGDVPAVALALADSFSTSRVLGVLTMDILNTQEGFATTFGSVEDLDTSSFANGTDLYLSDTVPGGFTTTAPDIATRIGATLFSHLTTGKIFSAIRSNISLPSVYGDMGGGSAGASLTPDVYALMSNYAASDNVVLPVDLVNGTITTPIAGAYSMTINLALTFAATANSSESFFLGIFESGVLANEFQLYLPKISEGITAFPKFSFVAIAGGIYSVRIKSSVAISTIVYQLSQMNITSVHIR